jgi:hypothetical protein
MFQSRCSNFGAYAQNTLTDAKIQAARGASPGNSSLAISLARSKMTTNFSALRPLPAA